MVGQTGRQVLAIQADVRDLDGMQAAVDEAVGRLGHLNIARANAGILSGGIPTWGMPDQMWQVLIDVNLTGVWITCKATAPHLIATGGGSIVITSSTAGLRPNGGIAHYVAAKRALMGLTRALAQELAPHNIRVNAVNPSSLTHGNLQPMTWLRLVTWPYLPRRWGGSRVMSQRASSRGAESSLGHTTCQP